MSCLEFRLRNPIHIPLLIVLFNSKGMLPSKHDIHDDAAGPHINSFAINMSLRLLWGHVDEGAHTLIDLWS